jgi:RNA polymerase sigma-70 factor (ECF subfamily)
MASIMTGGMISVRLARRHVARNEGDRIAPDEVRARVTPPPGRPSPTSVAAHADDVRAFEVLFREHYASLCRFADHYLRDRGAAEDLVQDLFAALWMDAALREVRGSVRAYLFSAVRNRALNVRKRRLVEREWQRHESAPEVRELHRAPARPDDLLAGAERDQRLAGAIAALPERCRLVMQLRWRDELSYAEIASILGISVKGVEIQLSRGLHALRERLRDRLR